MSMEREEIYRLVDSIPEDKLPDIKKLLKHAIEDDYDPVLHALANAPLDDEPVTEEEEERIRQADDDFKHGRTVSMDEVKKELEL